MNAKANRVKRSYCNSNWQRCRYQWKTASQSLGWARQLNSWITRYMHSLEYRSKPAEDHEGRGKSGVDSGFGDIVTEAICQLQSAVGFRDRSYQIAKFRLNKIALSDSRGREAPKFALFLVDAYSLATERSLKQELKLDGGVGSCSVVCKCCG